MIRQLIRLIRGYVKICVEGYSPERFINMCSRNGIYIWGLQPSVNGYDLYLALSDFKKIRPLTRKTHTKIILKERFGFPFLIFRWRKRKLFFLGFFLCIILMKGYSMFIWDIQFEGNVRWPDETLSEYLRQEGVVPLMLKSRVDCPAIVKNIRKEYNDIVWVSAFLEGNRLIIHVKENTDTFESDEITASGEEKPTDLIASADGVITDIVTRSGIPQVHEGDVVKKGDILVRGRIDITDDAGEITGYEYCRSDADIYADTSVKYENTLQLIQNKKVYDGKEKHLFYLRFDDTIISLGGIENQYKYCEFLTGEHQLKFGENVYLPVYWGMKTSRSYSFFKETLSKETARNLLSEEFQRFCKELEQKGIQIRGNDVKIKLFEKEAKAEGMIYLNETIAEETDTEIIMIEREETDESVGNND